MARFMVEEDQNGKLFVRSRTLLYTKSRPSFCLPIIAIQNSSWRKRMLSFNPISAANDGHKRGALGSLSTNSRFSSNLPIDDSCLLECYSTKFASALVLFLV